MEHLSRQTEALASLLAQASRAVAFTGAGMSTESGIPDFRSPGGLWTQNKPIPFDAFVASPEARREAWRRRFAMEESFAAAQPNIGHRALTALVRAGRLRGVITQNIDNLHQNSGLGADEVVEIHGNTTYATCLDCRKRYDIGPLRQSFEATGLPPECDDCEGIVKTATISFGQAMPDAEMRRATRWALESDLFLVLGSSLVVYPAAGIPLAAKQNGATLVIINREPTELDTMADLVIHGEIGTILAPFLQSPA